MIIGVYHKDIQNSIQKIAEKYLFEFHAQDAIQHLKSKMNSNE